ncbi:MAG: coenzyme F420 hydrogenase [Deltaproteobacteria bacterium RBG_13_58_19]|nr:MAG: coenzyme F420 hydrogenase [Deltaproteobacteria bacterium RBG_13_58_19]
MVIRDLFEKAVLIFGCGNILLGDDGFGPAVVRYLNDNYRLPQEVLALDVGTSIRELLFDLLLSEKKPGKIIIVDTVDYPGRRPGEVFEIPVAGIPAKKIADFSLHQFPTVNMLQELKEHSQIEIRIIAAQIAGLPEEVRPGLSPPVADAVSTAGEQIYQMIKFGL